MSSSDSNLGSWLLVILVVLLVWYYAKGSNVKPGVYKMSSGSAESYVKFHPMGNDPVKFPVADVSDKQKAAVEKARARFFTTNCTSKDDTSCAKFDPATEKLAHENVWLKDKIYYNRLADIEKDKNRYRYNPYKNRLSPMDVAANPVYNRV